MESFFAKIYLLLSLILSSISGTSYIQLGATSLNFDYRTGDSEPVYFLSVTNSGPQKARFDLSGDVAWITVYREGQPGVTSLEILQAGTVNLVIEIHPVQLADGSHQGRVLVKAFNPLGYEEQLDSKEVAITLNKNVVVASLTPPPSSAPSPSPSAEITPQVLVTPAKGTPQPAPIGPTSAVPTATRATGTTSPKATPGKIKEPPLRFRTPGPTPPSGKTPPLETTRPIFRSIWQFLRNLFF